MRREDLAALAEVVLEEEGFELVECTISRTNRSQTFRVSIDREGGVPIEACARVSREIATRLDANPLLHGAYQLEVSSAGMNRPIWKPEHYVRFSGEPVRMEVSDGEVSGGSPQRFLNGRIGPVDEAGVWILLEGDRRRLVPFPEIVRAQLRMDPWKKRGGAAGGKEDA